MTRIQNIITLPFHRIKRVKVYALVGDTGTGKSFRAHLVTEKRSIDLIIDDGLLIRDQRVLAGRSAKREHNKLRAIRTAVFEDPSHVEEVREALAKEKFRSILVLGTSEKMIGLIVEHLGLPFPDETIYIEDIATEEEIAGAQESRRIKGKHVIPVPVIEVKPDPSQRILDTIRLFVKRHPYLFWKKKVFEKTVVQPQYSRRGILSISESALTQMVMHCAEEYSKDVSVQRVIIEPMLSGYEMEVQFSIPYGLSIPDVIAGLHKYIMTNIERFSGIYVEKLDLNVVEVRSKPAKKK